MPLPFAAILAGIGTADAGLKNATGKGLLGTFGGAVGGLFKKKSSSSTSSASAGAVSSTPQKNSPSLRWRIPDLSINAAPVPESVRQSLLSSGAIQSNSNTLVYVVGGFLLLIIVFLVSPLGKRRGKR